MRIVRVPGVTVAPAASVAEKVTTRVAAAVFEIRPWKVTACKAF